MTSDGRRDPPPSDRELWRRLQRFLLAERSASHQDLDEIWSQPLPARVESGDAIAGVEIVEWLPGPGRLLVRAALGRSRFRVGDPLRLGFGDDPHAAPELRLEQEDRQGQRLALALPWGSDGETLAGLLAEAGRSARPLVLDRGAVDLTELMLESLARVYRGRGALEQSVRGLLGLRLETAVDQTEAARARDSVERLAARGWSLTASQCQAFVEAWSRRPFHLVQGPPGTGKTWLLALLLAALGWRGERILVTAQTHRAVDNVLTALGKVVGRSGRALSLVRVGARPDGAAALAGAGVACVSSARQVPRPAAGGGLVVGATLFGARRLCAAGAPTSFTRVAFDEAAQITLPHAACALLAAERWIFFGDDRQLGPVVVGDYEDPLAGLSIFAHLRAAQRSTRLDLTFRMSDAVCAFPARAFYDGALEPAESARSRRLTLRAPDGAFASVLDPSRGAVLVSVPHEGHRTQSPDEARLAAALAEELLVRQRLPAQELAIISPFRVQNREIGRRLRERLGPHVPLPLIDTVERIQGQEREAVIVSLACSDPDALRRDTQFFFSPNRLCVTLTRARTKLIVLASPRLLDTYPHDHEGLVRLDLFHRLFRELHLVDGKMLLGELP
ncbi:MAG: AAA family ATPase [Acidobacteriota bacterium]|nr:MAG: AAA family ATPase [Acidobacteriota bacterium]